MSQRRAKKSKKTTPVSQRFRDWWSKRQFGPVQFKILAGVLLILSALTILGLARISSGAVLDWWSDLLRQLFGWGAYLFAISLGLIGLWLLWNEVGKWLPSGPKAFIGFELLLVVVMVAAHAPLVVREGADAAFLAAQAGRGGGYVGWALGVPLMEGVGTLVGALVLFALLIVSLTLLLPSSWNELLEWARQRTRSVIPATASPAASGKEVSATPDPAEPPWWEAEATTTRSKRRKKPKQATSSGRARSRPAKPRARDGSMPSLDLLEPAAPHSYGDRDVRRKAQIIEETLASFGVPAKVVDINQGPTVTQFGLDPGYIERKLAGGDVQRQRVRVARIASLSDDLALALAASPIRIEAPVPGRSVVGLEVPNDTVSLVTLRGVVESNAFTRLGSPLAIALGEDVSGHPAAVDLGLMPHLLIAGATGSGKSVCINAVICCLLFNNRPEDLKLLMVDPKMVELVGYNDIPHLMAPVVVEVQQVVGALAWITHQMDERYQLFHKAGSRNLDDYNRMARRRSTVEELPRLVVFIDELADMMMIAPDEVERHICRLAQMGRATGIHLVIATQRPSVDVVTGLIKANFPARISFAVTSQVDSRVILDQGGAESLLGRGDMLFMSPDQAAPIRLQGCFVADKEIDRLTNFWRSSYQAQAPGPASTAVPWEGFDADAASDDLLTQATDLARGMDRISTSFVQRKLRIGFPRAARLMDQLEDQGVVGPDERGGRGREVLIDKGIDFDEIDDRLPGVEPKGF